MRQIESRLRQIERRRLGVTAPRQCHMVTERDDDPASIAAADKRIAEIMAADPLAQIIRVIGVSPNIGPDGSVIPRERRSHARH